jgi:hypothetical protein
MVGNDGLKHTAFPENADDFEKLYVDAESNTIKNAELFMRRAIGLTSYYFSGEGDVFPNAILRDITLCPFSDEHFSQYRKIRDDEIDLEQKAAEKARKKRFRKFTQSGENEASSEDVNSTFRVFSRQFSNFVFPQPIIRPLPPPPANRFKLGPDPEKWSENEKQIASHLVSGDSDKLDDFIQAFKAAETARERSKLIASTLKSHGCTDDQYEGICNAEEQFIYEKVAVTKSYAERINIALRSLATSGKHAITKELSIYGPKMEAIYRNITEEEPQGLCFVYSQFRTMEGITIFTEVLNAHGFKPLDPSAINEHNIKKYPQRNRYVIYSGEEDNVVRSKIRWIFNHPANKHGEICKIFLGTAASAEGITLKNVRQVHIMEPYWNEVRIQQVIGRARRICSHEALPPSERNIHVFRYHMILTDQQKAGFEPLSTDEAIYEIAHRKKLINEEFLQLLKDSAIDCYLNLVHNRTDTNKINCFSFAEEDTGTDAYVPMLSEEKTGANIVPVESEEVKCNIVKVFGRKLGVKLSPNDSPLMEKIKITREGPGKGRVFDAIIYYNYDALQTHVFTPEFAEVEYQGKKIPFKATSFELTK